MPALTPALEERAPAVRTVGSASESKELKSRSIRGLLWSFAGQSMVFASQIAALAVLARLLTQEQMGHVALTFTAVNLALVFGGCGLARGLVQQRNPRPADLPSAFWGSTIAGVAAWALLVVLAPAVARFVEAEQLAPVLAASGAMLLLVAIWQVPASILERQLRFRELETAQIFGYALPFAVATIGAALLGGGSASLVVGAITGGLIQTILLLRASGFRPQGRPEWAATKRLLGFGAGITGSSAVAFAVANVDYLIVGRVLGPAQLGLYSIAYQLATIPRSRIAVAFIRVAFPALSRIQHDPAQLNRAYIRLGQSVAFIAFPLLACLLVLGEPAIQLVFGEKWIGAAPALRLLCPAGALMAVRATVGSALAALGRPQLGLYTNLSMLLVSIPILYLAAPGGIERVAAAVLLIAILDFFPLQWVLRALTGLSVTRFCGALVRPAALAALTGAAVYLAALGFETPFGKLAVGALAGAATYAGLLASFGGEFLRTLKQWVRAASGTRDPGPLDLPARD